MGQGWYTGPSHRYAVVSMTPSCGWNPLLQQELDGSHAKQTQLKYWWSCCHKAQHFFKSFERMGGPFLEGSRMALNRHGSLWERAASMYWIKVRGARDSPNGRILYWYATPSNANLKNCLWWFRMQRHDWSSTSPKEPMLHLSLSPCTLYQLQLASSSRHWCLHIEQPQAQHPPNSTHYYKSTSPPEVWDLLVRDASWYYHREAQNHSQEHSRSPFLAGGMIFPPPSGMLDPCQSSSKNWKLISFNTTWLHPKKNNTSFTFSKSSSFFPSLASLYLFEQCLRLGVMSNSSICLPLQD